MSEKCLQARVERFTIGLPEFTAHCMETDPLSFQIRAGDIDRIAGRVQEYFRTNREIDCSRQVVRDALAEWFETEAVNLWEQAAELLTTPRMNESREFQRILERKIASAEPAYPASEFQPIFDLGEASVFNGQRSYSRNKLGAMIQYLTSRGYDIYKTQLNKLLFYGDLAFFDLAGVGMSGAVYRNRPFGPVADPVEDLLMDLDADGKLHIISKPDQLGQRIIAEPAGAETELSPAERRTLDWVLETFGRMRSGEISDLSHSELAYKFTKPNQPIAYEYAKFFKYRPPSDLLDQ
ncbi:MAG TPA: Panacea domain-containing protein [Pyrinomonadaceae bacterium]|nr:Panacea domain-containing protein [Pyrinomonadaceae bacterium]